MSELYLLIIPILLILALAYLWKITNVTKKFRIAKLGYKNSEEIKLQNHKIEFLKTIATQLRKQQRIATIIMGVSIITTIVFSIFLIKHFLGNHNINYTLVIKTISTLLSFIVCSIAFKFYRSATKALSKITETLANI